jgi:hypothetical protein
MAKTQVHLMQPQVCKCCGQYINPPRESRPRKTKRYATDRFLKLEQDFNDLDNLHWELIETQDTLKDAYVELRDRQDLTDSSIYEPLWLSTNYFLFTVEHLGDLESAMDRLVRCNLNSRAIKSSSIGCLIINDSTYLFFWTLGGNNAGV